MDSPAGDDRCRVGTDHLPPRTGSAAAGVVPDPRRHRHRTPRARLRGLRRHRTPRRTGAGVPVSPRGTRVGPTVAAGEGRTAGPRRLDDQHRAGCPGRRWPRGHRICASVRTGVDRVDHHRTRHAAPDPARPEHADRHVRPLHLRRRRCRGTLSDPGDLALPRRLQDLVGGAHHRLDRRPGVRARVADPIAFRNPRSGNHRR